MYLYAAFLGGELARERMGEDHEVVFVVADDIRASSDRSQGQMGAVVGGAHVDALCRVEMVDGYAVRLEHSGSGDVTSMTGYN